MKITGDRATVGGNYIGTDARGTIGQGNSGDGVQIIDADDATVSGNLISANSGYGVHVSGTALNAAITGNKIGTDADGTIAVGNSGDGITVVGTDSATISGNVVSANGGDGVSVASEALNITITNNKIGTNEDGSSQLGNSGDGVSIRGMSSLTLVTSNVVSGNLGNGVRISGSGTTSNLVEGIKIGVTADASGKLPNNGSGVLVDGGPQSNKIQGGNIISGNDLNGVHLSGTGTSSNIVAGNKIGTNDSNATGLGNKGSGVRIDDQAGSNEIKGANVISGNLENGMWISGSDDNIVESNKIGVTADGAGNLPNTKDGVLIDGGAKYNTIQGGNVISGNIKNGVRISGIGTNDNVIASNKVGTNGPGSATIASVCREKPVFLILGGWAWGKGWFLRRRKGECAVK